MRGEGRPLVGPDPWPALVEDGGVAVHARDDRDGAPRVSRDERELVPQPGRVQFAPQDAAGGAARESGHDHRMSQCGQDAGDIDTLAARALVHGVDLVRGVRDEVVDDVGDVEGGVERDGEDHRDQIPTWSGRAVALASFTARQA